MTLKAKLISSFAVLIVLLASVGGYSSIQLREILGDVMNLTQNWMPSIKAVGDIRGNINEVRRQQLQHVIAREESDMEEIERSLKAINGRRMANSTIYEKLITSPEERAAFLEYNSNFEQYLAGLDKLIVLSRQNRTEEAMALDKRELKPAFDAAISALRRCVEMNDKGSKDSGDAAGDRVSTTQQVNIALVVVALLIGVGAAVFLIRSTLNQLGEDPGYLQGVSTEIAAGNLNVNFRSERPLSGVYQAMQAMVATLKGKIAEADEKTVLAEAKEREAVAATAAAEEARKQAENAKREGMIQAAQKLEGVVEVVSSASEELSAQIEQSDRGAEEQSKRVAETATSMEEMNASVLEVARNAGTAATSSENARNRAEAGADIVNNVVREISQVQQQSMDLKRDMEDLGRQAEAIGQIMNVISDIADQTNLLALNAAIEAARAGDAGRGFAVVADEVRKLAEKTMQATSEVGSAIRGIQQGAQKNMDNVDRSVRAIEETTRLAQESGASLKEIVALVDSATDQVRGIATASEQQSAASEEINRAVEQVSTISAETAQAMREAAKAVSELSNQAQVLRRLVEELKQA
ncbi:Methyl-accepting chemotaxis protein (MCP) signaling domain protein [anaerobic digester metagenome]|uniref:HAMP domain-containing methyl-accepting chemotaxis protein n=1 Tax=Nitratidesulfovibrio liaohensis TaxID=2604158 RepID=UPI00141E0CB5|nr:methyl-accepting chemotaxis protein [Nitratidesulfovibrio liaohensis]NHZ45979.1 methyl-accepting chemotaxis protein [Nitratidesulfovibrio liaohensis]